MSGLKCDGACENHVGIVRPINVRYFGQDWNFNYCEAAIAEDEDRGFTVTEVNPDSAPPTEPPAPKEM